VSPSRAFLSPQPDRAFTHSQTLNPLSVYSCKLFVLAPKLNSFAIKQMQALCAKCRGMASAGLPGGHPEWGMPATSPRLKSATYKLFPPRRVSKEVTPPPAPQRTAFSRVTDHKSLHGGVRFLAHSVRSVPPWQTHPGSLSPLECAFTLNCPLTEPVLSVSVAISILLALCFHILTNCFSRNSFVFTTIRIARGVCHRSKLHGCIPRNGVAAVCAVNNRPLRRVFRIGAE
jgi:hypothetical protein